MEEPIEGIQERLLSVDWEDLYPRLLKYATHLRHYYGLYYTLEPRDLVQEAIQHVLTGIRAWPQNVKPLPFFILVIKRVAWREVEKSKRHPGAGDGFEEEGDGIPLANEDLKKAIRKCVQKRCRDDQLDLLLDIADILFEAPRSKPKEIYKALKNNVKYEDVLEANVINACRRLRRILYACLKRLGFL